MAGSFIPRIITLLYYAQYKYAAYKQVKGRIRIKNEDITPREAVGERDAGSVTGGRIPLVIVAKCRDCGSKNVKKYSGKYYCSACAGKRGLG